ncbi:DUF6660 family protein [Parapedobacter soli]|uniref:DUF6660 family protein n=1 Tax=Parapedobacter soli TaxID=416955 RepID=UPI0021C7F9E5|nr:DUF6660 family protein [Parapedobacter soli]
MKVFSSILALFMMALFLMPCADIYEKNVFNNQEHSTEITHQDTHDHTESDLCTPFCLCGCCGIVSGVVLQWNIFNIGKIKSFDLSKPKVYYKSIFISRYLGEIWQPPKINA